MIRGIPCSIPCKHRFLQPFQICVSDQLWEMKIEQVNLSVSSGPPSQSAADTSESLRNLQTVPGFTVENPTSVLVSPQT